MLGYCSLQASGAVVERGRPVHLAERGGGRGLEREVLEPALPVRPQLGGHAPPHERPAHGRRLGLQLRQLAGVFLGQGFGDRRQQLRHLHQRTLQAAQRSPQLLGVAGLIDVDAEQALAGEARRQPTHGAGHLGVATNPSGERVLRLAVSHARSAMPSALGQLGVQLVDQRLDHAETAAPEAGVARIEAERRQQLLMAQRAAGFEQLQDSAPRSPPGWPGRPRTASSPGSRRRHRRRRRTARARSAGCSSRTPGRRRRSGTPGRGSRSARRARPGRARRRSAPPRWRASCTRRSNSTKAICRTTVLSASSILPASRIRRCTGSRSAREQGAKGQLLAEHRGGLGERQRRRCHQRTLPAGEHLMHAVAQLMRQRHDVARAPLVVHEHVGVHARHGRVAERAGILARPQGGIDPALAEEALEDLRRAAARSRGRRRAR